MMFPAHLVEKAEHVLKLATEQRLRISTIESCTGGLLAALITEIPGASRVYTYGYVTYANEAKNDMVGVPLTTLAHHGAVSEQVARAMAEGARARANADLAVAISGIAGPSGGTENKPVGTVHIACAVRSRATAHQHQLFKGDRAAVRLAAVEHALDMLLEALSA